MRAGLWSLLGALVVFGAIVEMRSAFLKRRMTDADVFFRAAWAVRTGADIYEIRDTNGWHYHYPPLFAIALTPLANGPPGWEGRGYLPYKVSVALWYVLSVGSLWLAVHWLANALQRAAPEELKFPRYSRGWWLIRVGPVLFLIMDVGRTLSRGQSNTIILLFLCGMIAAFLCGRKFVAGMCLAGAICIKIFPAFLLLYPIVRRDFRALAGVAAGLFLGVVLIPALVLGPTGALEAHLRVGKAVLGPGLGVGDDTSRQAELGLATGPGSQSFMILLHNYIHPDRATRPQFHHPGVRTWHTIIAGALSLLTLLMGWRARPSDAISEALFLGALIVIMLPSIPVCHAHYFILLIPLAMALIADAWERHEWPMLGRGLATVLAAMIGANVLVSMPFTNLYLREFGVPLYAALALWATGLVAIRRRARTAAVG